MFPRHRPARRTLLAVAVFLACLTGLALAVHADTPLTQADYADIPLLPVWLNDRKPDAFGKLGNLVKARLDVREAAIGPMRELHKLTHQPVNLSVRQGDEIVYIERTYSERSGMQVVRAVGGRAPLHLTSVGKLFLANDEPQRVRAYATRTGLTGHTRNSLTDLPMLERELDKIRKTSISRDDEELELGVRCMAAGIYDDQGRLVAGLSVSAPADRLEETWLERVKETAARISAALGHGGVAGVRS